MDLRAKITEALIEAQACADTSQPLTADQYANAAMGPVEEYVQQVDRLQKLVGGLIETVEIAREDAARSMRDRIVQAIDDAPDYAVLESVIRALPLLPDTAENVQVMRHCVLCASGEHQPSDHDTA